MDTLKSLRVRAGMTQRVVASALGLKQTTVSMWENGTNMPRAETLPKIASLYGCSIDDLLGHEPKTDEAETTQPRQEV